MKKILISLFCACSSTIFAQDIIVTNSGESLKVKELDLSPAEYVYYQLADSNPSSVQKLKKSDILIIRLADGKKIDPNTSTSTAPVPVDKEAVLQNETRFPNIDLTDFHGLLLAKGNCVYVTSNSDIEYEKAAVERIKSNMKNIGYWTVVDTPEQAHFVLQYGICTKGQDRAFVYLRTRNSYLQQPHCSYDIWAYKVREPGSMIFTVLSGSEDVNDNIRTADDLFGRTWKSWEKELSKEKLNKKVKEIFYIP